MRFPPSLSDRPAVPPARPLFASVVRLSAALFLGFSGLGLLAQQMDAPTPGLLEVGAPLFNVHTSVSLSLGAPPTDLHVLPDGRILVFANQQLALGDGTRWEVFLHAEDEAPLTATGVAVDANGDLYVAAPDGFAQIQFEERGGWRAHVVQPWPADDRRDGAAPRKAIEAGPAWLWHSGSGPILAWRPGEPARAIGRVDSIQHAFWFQGTSYVSDRTGGALWRIDAGGMHPVSYAQAISASDTITCAVPLDEEMLVGTYRRGLRVFDGRTLRPFGTAGLMTGDIQVNDLCATAGGFYAAAIENLGVVFFDASGRVVQVLDRSYDRRLGRVLRLVAAPGGVIWGLLSDGVLQVEFPSRISHFEPLIGSGLNVAQPFRFEGRLWILADGTARRAIYDDHGRMIELRPDTPAGRFVSNPSTEMGVLVVATDRGAYCRQAEQWVAFAPEVDNLRLVEHPPVNGRWLYGATGQIGWIARRGDTFQLESFAEPSLEKIYGSVAAGDGSVWLELGNGRLGRMRLVEDRPMIEYFCAEHGVPDNWAQVFRWESGVRFNVGDRILRFDESARRFVPDTEFARRFPRVTDIVGRPGRDSRGRWWITTRGGVQVLEERPAGWRDLHEKMPAGFRPYYFTFQPDGVVWMHADGHLTRFDPAIATVPEVPLHALITRIETGAGRRMLLSPAALETPLPYADNSLTAHFCAPSSAFKPVEFDVWLEGGRAGWMPLRSSGSIAFKDLREGRYRLHVRPQSGTTLGTEATVEFAIRPPWYRTLSAYVAFCVVGLGLTLVGGRLTFVLQRRKNTQLERLVAERTRELHASNERLAAQLEQNQILSKAIEQSPAAIYIVDRQDRIIFANPRAHELNGRVETGLVGQPLSAFRASSVTPELFQQIHSTVTRGETWRGQLANRQADGRVIQLRSLIAPIRHADGEAHHYLVLEEDITESLNEQERRRRLEAQLIQAQKLESIGTLAGGIAHDFNNILTAILGYCELAGQDAPDNAALQGDLAGIRSAGTRAKELVARILTFSRQTHVQLVPLDLAQPVAEAVKLIRASAPSTVEIVATLQSGTIRADATQIQQVVLNLCTNALQALPNERGRLEITVQSVQVSREIAAEVDSLWIGEAMRLVVSDDGSGMDASTLGRIFDPFFTTKPQGEGTGLGLSIVQGVVTGHQGAMRVRSSPGLGTSFEIYFPPSSETSSQPAPNSPVPRGAQREIIVVDDERSVANFVATRLHQLGYRPMMFCDPQAALNAFAAQPNRFQAIVTDLTMPRLTGADLIRQIRSRGWLIPAVIITGYRGDAVRANVKALPRCVVLPKPFSGDDLARALHTVISDYAVQR